MEKPTYSTAALAKSDAKFDIEIWRDIPDYQGYYQVSNLGRIRSVPRVINNVSNMKISYKSHIKGRIIKQRHNRNDYTLVTLHKKGIRHDISVAKMIAKIFLPNPHHYKVVIHYNGIHADNNLANLDWCSLKLSHQRGPMKHGSVVTLIKDDFRHVFLSHDAAASWLKKHLSLRAKKISILGQISHCVRSGKLLHGFHVKSVMNYRRHHTIVAIYQNRHYQFNAPSEAARWLKHVTKSKRSIKSTAMNITHCCMRTRNYYHTAKNVVFYYKDHPASTGRIHSKALIVNILLYNSEESHEFKSEINAALWLKRAVNTPVTSQTIASEISSHIYRQTIKPLFGRFRVKVIMNRG